MPLNHPLIPSSCSSPQDLLLVTCRSPTLLTSSCQYNSIHNASSVGPLHITGPTLNAYRIGPFDLFSYVPLSFLSSQNSCSPSLLSFFYISHQSSNLATLSSTMHPLSLLWVQFTRCSHFGHWIFAYIAMRVRHQQDQLHTCLLHFPPHCIAYLYLNPLTWPQPSKQ